MSARNDGGLASTMPLRDFHAAHAPFTLFEAQAICGDGAELATESGRAALIAVLVQLRLEYADAMLRAREAQ